AFGLSARLRRAAWRFWAQAEANVQHSALNKADSGQRTAAALFLTTRLNFMTSDSTRTHQRRAAFVWALCAAFALIATHSISRAQERPSGADPRVGLKAGLRDAGVAARGMELVANLPKPQGFFDPKAPGGDPTPAETDDNRGPGRGATAAGGATAG